MKAELILKFSFEATHHLADYEIPHLHIWKLEVSVQGTPLQGRVLDIVQLRTSIESIIRKIEKTDLNQNLLLNEETRKSPTCETLCPFFFSEIQILLKERYIPINPSVSLYSTLIAICDMNQVEMGAVRVTV